ncbi:MAG: hypothetical protein KF794_10330 [Xanthobacteraceae bacterium]|nr:hypothetical protein [Xanthobacteraceae bacterium]QYK44185.1 MAG: hypothetical protein KF794_10330 [Xanthobacteraceae bacterium]
MIEMIRAFFAKVGGPFMRSDLDELESDQVKAIARDIGMTADDLYRLDRRGDSSYLLLPERLVQEGIKPTVVQAEWPSVWKDLQRVCALCDHADVCQRDLDAHPDSGEWHSYCPNESTMKFLQS